MKKGLLALIIGVIGIGIWGISTAHDCNLFNEISVIDWKESIKIAGKPLLEKNIITENYINAMIESIEKLGFYVILRDNLAMPHARPEDGTLGTGVSLLKLNNPVYYGNSKVQLVFVLATKDADSHMETLMQLMELFQDDESIEKLINSKDYDEILEIIKNIA